MLIGYVVVRGSEATLTTPLIPMTLDNAKVIVEAKKIEYPAIKGWRVAELHEMQVPDAPDGSQHADSAPVEQEDAEIAVEAQEGER